MDLMNLNHTCLKKSTFRPGRGLDSQLNLETKSAVGPKVCDLDSKNDAVR